MQFAVKRVELRTNALQISHTLGGSPRCAHRFALNAGMSHAGFPSRPQCGSYVHNTLAQRHAVFLDHVPGVASFISSSPLSLRGEPTRSNHSACAAVHRMMFQFYMAF